jgi:hypothetical protein
MSEDVLREAISRLVPSYGATGSDWQDVLHRAEVDAVSDRSASPTRPDGRRWRRRPLIAAALAAGVAFAGAATAVAYHYLGPSPGFSGGVSALDRLPAAASVPSSISESSIAGAAAYAGISSNEGLRRMRLLRQGPQGDLYAFEGDNGTVCMFLASRFANCLGPDNAVAKRSHPGVMATISPGHPGDTPAFVAVVAANISSISLIVNGHRTNTPIVNNAVYFGIDGLTHGDTISAEVQYGNGTTKTFRLANPYGE